MVLCLYFELLLRDFSRYIFYHFMLTELFETSSDAILVQKAIKSLLFI